MLVEEILRDVLLDLLVFPECPDHAESREQVENQERMEPLESLYWEPTTLLEGVSNAHPVLLAPKDLKDPPESLASSDLLESAAHPERTETMELPARMENQESLASLVPKECPDLMELTE